MKKKIVFIIVLLLLAYNGVREYQASNERNVSDNQVVEFNNQFSTYDRQDDSFPDAEPSCGIQGKV